MIFRNSARRFGAAIAATVALAIVPAVARATMPPDSAYTPLYQDGAAMTDPADDGNNNGREVVGDASNPAVYVASDSTHRYFRLRLDSSPAQGMGVRLYGWGCEIDTDGDFGKYEYIVSVDGTGGTQKVLFAKNTSGSVTGDPSTVATLEISNQALVVGSSGNAEITLAGSNFNGNADYFLSWSIPTSALAAEFDPSVARRYVCGTSSSGNSLTLDLAGTSTAPGTGAITLAISDPVTCSTSGCSSCGDGTVGGGEACDDATSGDCCSATCQYDSAGTACTSDGVSCTNDTCNASGTCQHATNDAACNDGNFCDGTETCHATLGCQEGAPPSCDDGIDCTTDGCSGACTHTPVDSACDNFDYCDGEETCSATLGCQAGTPPSCDDGNPCTADGCFGACLHLPDDSFCDDDLACNGAETCGIGGCVAGTPMNCDDGIACTTDSCPASSCLHAPVDASCGDGDACNGVETCNAATGCVAGSAPDCDDGDLCSQDACDSMTGCTNTYEPASTCAAAPAKAQLSISTTSGKESVQFKWLKGSFDVAALGDPTDATDYALCVFDSTSFVGSLQIPGGALCGGEPCWTASTKGVSFKDKALTYDGAKQLKASPGTSGKVQLKAQGSNLPVFTLGAGLGGPVTAQLVTSDAGCWQAEFATDGEKTNDGTNYKALYKAP